MSSGEEDGSRLATYFGLQQIGDSPVERKLTDIKRRKTKARLYALLGLVVGGAAFLFSLRAVGFSLAELFVQWPEFVQALREYFPTTTYFGVLPFVDLGTYWAFMLEADLFNAAIVTLSIAFAGTVLGVFPALFFSVMASERVVPYPFNFGFRAVMSMIRSIPALVWVLI
jgi:ABC-type phosphate/phosphonate transport system, permease component